jgi:hypothetical protein
MHALCNTDFSVWGMYFTSPPFPRTAHTFMTTITKCWHWTRSWASLILSFHLLPGPSKVVDFQHVCARKFVRAFFCLPIRATFLTHFKLRNFSTLTTLDDLCESRCFSSYSSLMFLYSDAHCRCSFIQNATIKVGRDTAWHFVKIRCT